MTTRTSHRPRRDGSGLFTASSFRAPFICEGLFTLLGCYTTRRRIISQACNAVGGKKGTLRRKIDLLAGTLKPHVDGERRRSHPSSGGCVCTKGFSVLSQSVQQRFSVLPRNRSQRRHRRKCQILWPAITFPLPFRYPMKVSGITSELMKRTITCLFPTAMRFW